MHYRKYSKKGFENATLIVMRKIILIVVLLVQTLVANAFFAKPRIKLNHDVTDQSLIMALDSGKKFIVEFHNVAVCKQKKCRTKLEVDSSLKDTIKVIGKEVDKLDKHDKQAHHTIEVEYNAKSVNGYVTLKDADSGEILNKIKVMVRNDNYCYETTEKIQGKITFPDGDAYIMDFNNKCELEKAGAVLYEKN